jgi:hypothetical protein
MSVINKSSQVLVKYTALNNVAQVNDAIVAYAGNDNAITGLNAIKTAMLATITSATACVQCASIGKVDASGMPNVSGPNICPLCSGMTKTQGQYTIASQVIGFNSPA